MFWGRRGVWELGIWGILGLLVFRVCAALLGFQGDWGLGFGFWVGLDFGLFWTYDGLGFWVFWVGVCLLCVSRVRSLAVLCFVMPVFTC